MTDESTFPLGTEIDTTLSFGMNQVPRTLSHSGVTYIVMFDSGKIRLIDSELNVDYETSASKGWSTLGDYHVEQVSSTENIISFNYYNISDSKHYFIRVTFDGSFTYKCSQLLDDVNNKGVRCDDDACYTLSGNYTVYGLDKTTCAIRGQHRLTNYGGLTTYAGEMTPSWAVDFEQDGLKEMVFALNTTVPLGYSRVNGTIGIIEILANGTLKGDNAHPYYKYHSINSTYSIDCLDQQEFNPLPLSYFVQYDGIGDYELITGYSYTCASESSTNIYYDLFSAYALLNADMSEIVLKKWEITQLYGTSTTILSYLSVPVFVELDVTTAEKDMCFMVTNLWGTVAGGTVTVSKIHNYTANCLKMPSETLVKYYYNDSEGIGVNRRDYMYMSDFNDNNLVDFIMPDGILYDIDLKGENAYNTTLNYTLAFSSESLYSDYFGIADVDDDDLLDAFGTSATYGTQLHKAQVGGGYVPAANCTETVYGVRYFTGDPICVNESIYYRVNHTQCEEVKLYVDCYGDGEQIAESDYEYDPIVSCYMNKTQTYQANIWVMREGQVLDTAEMWGVHSGSVINDVYPNCYTTGSYDPDEDINIWNTNVVAIVPEGEQEDISDDLGGVFEAMGFRTVISKLVLGLIVIVIGLAIGWAISKNLGVAMIFGVIAIIFSVVVGIIPIWILLMFIILSAMIFVVKNYLMKGEGGG